MFVYSQNLSELPLVSLENKISRRYLWAAATVDEARFKQQECRKWFQGLIILI